MSYETRVTIVMAFMMLTGWGIGYVQAYTKHRSHLRDAQTRAEAAYKRYWNNEGGEF
jgi:hypothetical protein